MLVFQFVSSPHAAYGVSFAYAARHCVLPIHVERPPLQVSAAPHAAALVLAGSMTHPRMHNYMSGSVFKPSTCRSCIPGAVRVPGYPPGST